MSILDAQRYAESMTRKEVADALKKGHPLVPGFLLADRAKQFQQNEALLKVLEEKANLPQPGQTITDKLQTYLQNSLSQERQELSPVRAPQGTQTAQTDMPGQGAGEAMPGARMPAGAGGPMPGPTMPPGAGQAINARRGGVVGFQGGGTPGSFIRRNLAKDAQPITDFIKRNLAKDAQPTTDFIKRYLAKNTGQQGMLSGRAIMDYGRKGTGGLRSILSKLGGVSGLAALSELAFPEELGGGDIPKLLRMEHRRASGGIVGLQNGGTPPGDYEGSGWGDAIGNWWDQVNEDAERRRQDNPFFSRDSLYDRMQPGYEDPRSEEERKEQFMDMAMGMLPMGTARKATGTALDLWRRGGPLARRPGTAVGQRTGVEVGRHTPGGAVGPSLWRPGRAGGAAKTNWWKKLWPWATAGAGALGIARLFAPDDEESGPQELPDFIRRPAPKGDDTSRYQTLYDMIEGYEERARTPSEQERQGWKMDAERAGELNEYSDTIAGLRPTDEQYGRKRKAAGLAALSRVAGRSGDPDEDQTFAQIADTLATEGTRQRGEKLGFENMLADIASQRYGVERGSLTEQVARQRAGDAWWQPMVGAKQSEIEQMFALDQARIQAAADQDPYAPEHLGKWIDLLEDNVVTKNLSDEVVRAITSNIARVARGGRAMGDGSEIAQLLALVDQAPTGSPAESPAGDTAEVPTESDWTDWLSPFGVGQAAGDWLTGLPAVLQSRYKGDAYGDVADQLLD